MHLSSQDDLFSDNDVSDGKEGSSWSKKGCTQLPSGVWVSPDRLPVLPRAGFPFLAKLTHGADHVSKGGYMDTGLFVSVRRVLLMM